jgi:YCII-related domain
MGKYVYVYKGGSMPETEEEGKAVMEAWMSWLGGLGDSVVDVGNPFGASSAVGGSASGLGGYSIINADSLDDAVSKADGCPILAAGGAVEVYETVAM